MKNDGINPCDVKNFEVQSDSVQFITDDGIDRNVPDDDEFVAYHGNKVFAKVAISEPDDSFARNDVIDFYVVDGEVFFIDPSLDGLCRLPAEWTQSRVEKSLREMMEAGL